MPQSGVPLTHSRARCAHHPMGPCVSVGSRRGLRWGPISGNRRGDVFTARLAGGMYLVLSHLQGEYFKGRCGCRKLGCPEME